MSATTSKPSVANAAAPVVVPASGPTFWQRLQFLSRKYWWQLTVLGLALLIVFCKRTNCENPVCSKLPSFMKVCQQRPLPGGIRAGPEAFFG